MKAKINFENVEVRINKNKSIIKLKQKQINKKLNKMQSARTKQFKCSKIFNQKYEKQNN